jgi:hypothetical protein
MLATAERREQEAASSPANGQVHRLDAKEHVVGAHELNVSDLVSPMYPLLLALGL